MGLFLGCLSCSSYIFVGGMLHSLWNLDSLTDQGSNPCPLRWLGGVLTPGPPAKSCFPCVVCTAFHWRTGHGMLEGLATLWCWPGWQWQLGWAGTQVSQWVGQAHSWPHRSSNRVIFPRSSLKLAVVVQPLSRVRLFVTPWSATRQTSLSFTISQSLLKLMSIESVMPSNHLLSRPLLLLPSIFPSISVFSSEATLCIRWPGTGASTSASVLPMNIQGWFPFGLTGLILQSKGLSRAFSTTTVQTHQFFGTHTF